MRVDKEKMYVLKAEVRREENRKKERKKEVGRLKLFSVVNL